MTALVTAVTSAVINPDTVGALFSGRTGPTTSGGSTARQSTTEPGNPPLVLRERTLEGITVRVPQEWRYVPTVYNPLGQKKNGSAMALGPDPGLESSFVNTRLWVAAGRGLVKDLKVTPQGAEKQIENYMDESLDWSNHGCERVEQRAYSTSELVGRLQGWTGCEGVPDHHYYEIVAVTRDYRAAVVATMNHRDDLSTDTAIEVLSSLTVDPALLAS